MLHKDKDNEYMHKCIFELENCYDGLYQLIIKPDIFC